MANDPFSPSPVTAPASGLPPTYPVDPFAQKGGFNLQSFLELLIKLGSQGQGDPFAAPGGYAAPNPFGQVAPPDTNPFGPGAPDPFRGGFAPPGTPDPFRGGFAPPDPFSGSGGFAPPPDTPQAGTVKPHNWRHPRSAPGFNWHFR